MSEETDKKTISSLPEEKEKTAAPKKPRKKPARKGSLNKRRARIIRISKAKGTTSQFVVTSVDEDHNTGTRTVSYGEARELAKKNGIQIVQ